MNVNTEVCRLSLSPPNNVPVLATALEVTWRADESSQD